MKDDNIPLSSHNVCRLNKIDYKSLKRQWVCVFITCDSLINDWERESYSHIIVRNIYSRPTQPLQPDYEIYATDSPE